MEILDLYDDSGQKLKETINRGEKTEEGKNIMLSVAFIKNSKGEFLIQKTSKEKENRCSSTGGHVMHGETGLETIKRELEEELGISATEQDLKYIATFKYPKKNCIFNVYLLNIDIDLSKIKLQDAEVESVKYLSVEEINNIINKGNFLESHAYIFKHYINN